jgi:hypothetical protein
VPAGEAGLFGGRDSRDDGRHTRSFVPDLEEGVVIGKSPRIVFVIAAAVLALAFGVQPALAATIISGPTGSTGDFDVFDTQLGLKGAKCVYEGSGDFELDKIKVRPPRVYGAYANKTWVGWRFKILRRAVNVDWHTVYTSSIQKDRASNSIAADDFTWRTWFAPQNPTGAFKVRIVIFWYAPGTQTTKEGKVVVEYDWYRLKEMGNPIYLSTEGLCFYFLP